MEMSETRPPITAGPMLRAFRALNARASRAGPAIGEAAAAGWGDAFALGLPCEDAVPAASPHETATRRPTSACFVIRRGYWLARALSTRGVRIAGSRGKRRERLFQF